MSRLDLSVLSCLTVLAIFIWLRDLAWASTLDDTLPILMGIPLFYWIGRPWHLTQPQDRLSSSILVGTALLFLLGILFNSTLLLTLGWVYLLWSWLRLRTPQEEHAKIAKLLILPLLSFPWITLDARALGWWFRLSGAQATGAFFSTLGLDVKVVGTYLLVNGLPISVEAACSGLNTLQSLLIAGSFLAYVYLGNSARYWWNIPLLIVIAWIANTLRIVVISGVALAVSPEFALGAFHLWGGWLVLTAMFLLCWLAFYLQEPNARRPPQ
jgi:exosortase